MMVIRILFRRNDKLENRVAVVRQMKVTKRNGNVVLYDDEKVIQSILRANADAAGEELSEKTAAYIAGAVFARLSAMQEIFSTEDVRRCVWGMLKEKGFPRTAEKYLDYRK